MRHQDSTAAAGEAFLGAIVNRRSGSDMKIDIHTHILPREWPDLDKKFGYPGFVRLEHCDECSAQMMIGDRVFREITEHVWEPQRRIEEMDRAGVSLQVLSTVPVMFSYWAKPRDALDLC